MSTRWRIQLLGELRAAPAQEGAGRVVTRFRTQKTGALLAYLAHHLQRSHPRDVLIELLWPEGDPDAGRHSLSQALSSLRHQLEPPGLAAGSVIVADRASVRLNPLAVTTDVTEFETALRTAAAGTAERLAALTHAVELYRGAFLPGYYEDWILTEREWLADRYQAALSQLLALLEAGGELERALEYAQRGVRADPLREEAHAALMRLHAAAGRPSLALRQYRELERLLKEELEEVPTERTRVFAEQLRRSGGTANPEAPARKRAPSRTGVETVPAEEAERGAQGSPVSTAPSPRPASFERGGRRRARQGVPPPTGTVTYLLTSDEADLPAVARSSEAGRAAQERRLETLRRQLRQHAGYEFSTGEGVLAGAFATAREALACAVAGQRALETESDRPDPGALRVRMALHTGEAGFERGEYRGAALEQAIRLLGAGHGGQILCSESTVALLRRSGLDTIGAGLRFAELGIFRLHGGTTTEPLFQVATPGLVEQAFPPLRAEAVYADHLPLPLTRFFGRETELAQLQALLAPVTSSGPDGGEPTSPGGTSPAGTTRLVTLTGAGGSGKTRLALEAARRSVAAYQGAVWFVSLAQVDDSERILDTVRDAMRLPRSPDVEPLEQIAAAVADRPGLVLLDRFEALVGAGGTVVRRLLQRVPSLRGLITSRQRLDLAGEREFPLAPLPTPEEGVPALRRSGLQVGSPVSGEPAERMNVRTPEQLMQCESVQLFVDRAQGVRPDFQVTKANAAAVASLCRRLEGIPLALELAAGRAQALTPSQMLAHLNRRFDFLVSRQRDADPRHRTLRAAIDSSYELLAPELQRIFARLSVFRGGWTLAAGAAIAELDTPTVPNPDPAGADLHRPDVLDYLEQLRECSLIEIEEEPEGIRYRLLETLREYAWERLQERGELAMVRDRHRDWFVALAERLDASAHGPEQRRLLGQLETEHDNLRAALEACRAAGDAEHGLRLAGALWKFWVAHGHIAEGRGWVEEALRRADALPVAEGPAEQSRRLRARLGAGALAFYQGEYATAAAHAVLSEALGRELGDAPAVTLSLNILGSVEADRGLYGQAMARFREGLTLAVAGGDTFGAALARHNLGAAEEAEGRYEAANTELEASLSGFRELEDTWGMALALGTLASTALRTGDHARVRALCREVLDHSQRLGHAAGIARSLRYLGVVARHAGDFDEAARLLHESLAIQDSLGGQHIFTECLEEIAKVAAHRRESERAVRLFGAAAALRAALGVTLQPADRTEYDHALRLAREQLSSEAFTSAWSEGQRMRLAQAVAYALGQEEAS